jgi:tetratricopeptide (TPR) repeat protein
MMTHPFAVLLVSVLPALAAQATAAIPAEIKTIMVKQMKGEAVTPSEQAKLAAFQDSKTSEELERIEQDVMSDKAVQEAVASALEKLATPEESPLPRPKAVDFSRAAAPTASDYVALAVKIESEAAAAIPPADKASIDAALVRPSTAARRANVAMLFLMRDDRAAVSKALYVAAATAIDDPKDAIIANNLGVALKNNEDYERSLKVLLWAATLQARSPVIESNLGWTTAYAGDFPTAKRRFQAALSIDKDFVNALEGLGILGRVENDAKAARLLKQSLRARFSPAAAKAIKEQQDEQLSQRIASEVARDAARADSPLTPPSPAIDPETLEGARWSDAIWSPFDAPKQTFDRPPVPEFINGNVKIAEREGSLANDYYVARRETLGRHFSAFGAAIEALPKDVLRSAPTGAPDGMTYPRSYEKELFALSDLERILLRRMKVHFTNFGRKRDYLVAVGNDLFGMGFLKGMTSQEVCAKRVQFTMANHASYYQNWQVFYDKSLADMDRYYRYSAFWIHRIVDPRVRHYADLRRDFIVQTYYNSILHGWGQWSTFIYTGDCAGSPPVQARFTVEELLVKNSKLKTFPEPNGDCHVPTGELDGGIAAIEATCERLKLTFRAGVKLTIERSFGAKEADDVTTFRLSGGVSKSLDLEEGRLKAGAVEAKLEAAYFVQMQNGAVTDHGVEGAAGISGEIGNENAATITIGAGIEGRITAQSGAKVSAKEPSVEIGGKALDYLGRQE